MLKRITIQSSWFLPSVLFILAFGLRMIKANYFSLWSDGFITSRWSRLDYLLEYHHFDNNAPLPPVINLFFKELFNNNFFAQRFPHILMVSLAVVIFYQLMVYLTSNKLRAFIFALVPLTAYLFIYYSQEIRPYSYVLFLTLVSFYYGYRVFVDEDRTWYRLVILILAFALLPLTHYIAWFHFASLDIALGLTIIFFGRQKLKNIFKLVVANLFIVLAYIPWADSIWLYITNNLSMRHNPLAKYQFTSRVFWELIDKLSGADGWWSRVLLAIFIVSAIYLGCRLVNRLILRQGLPALDKFAFLMVLYTLVFFFLLSRVRYTEDIFFWRHYMFLAWPFYGLIFYALNRFLEDLSSIKVLNLIAGVMAFGILGVFLISNIANTAAYFLAPDRYFNWPAVVDFIEPMLLNGSKQKIYIDNPGDLRIYLETQFTPERAKSILSAVEIVSRDKIKEIAKKDGDKVVFVRIATTHEHPADTKLSIIEPIEDFANMEVIGRSKYLDFLMDRGAAPFTGWYELHVVYY